MAHPGWTSYTHSNYVLDIAFDDASKLWTVGYGGVIRWDPTDGIYIKYTVEHGRAYNYLSSIAVAPHRGAVVRDRQRRLPLSTAGLIVAELDSGAYERSLR
jgi:hypothetical protein